MEDNVIDIDLDMEDTIENTPIYNTDQATTITSATPIDPNLTPEDDIFSTRPEAIFLLGLDNMSTKDINNYCENTSLKKIEWIDDSSCVLVYENEEEAKKAAQQLISETTSTATDIQLNTTTLYKAKPFIRANYENKSKDENDSEKNDKDGEEKEKKNNKENDKDEEEMDISRPPLIPIIDQLQIRMATYNDVKKRGARERSRYYLFHGIDDSHIKNTDSHHRYTKSSNHHHPYSRNQRHQRHRHRHHDDDDNDKYSSRKRHHRSRRRSLSPNRRSNSKLDDDKPIEIPERLRGRLGKLS